MSGHLFSVKGNLDKNGGIAQLGEHLPCKQGVSGSIPLTSTNTAHFGAVSAHKSSEKDNNRNTCEQT